MTSTGLCIGSSKQEKGIVPDSSFFSKHLTLHGSALRKIENDVVDTGLINGLS